MEVILLRPLWLLLLPGVVFLAVLLRRRAGAVGDWSRVIAPHLMQAMAALGRIEGGGRRISGGGALVAGAVIVIALSGPALERRESVGFRNLDGVIFVVDVSASMTGDANWPRSRTMGRIAVAALGAKPAALIVFAGDAYIASALTRDSDQIGLTLALLDQDTVPDPGSRPARGLTLAAEMLRQAGIVAGDVVLISDGGGAGPDVIDAARAIRAAGARLSVVLAPTEQGDPATAFAPLARIGDAELFTLAEADRLVARMGQSARMRMEALGHRRMFWADYGRVLLLLALIPLGGLFRRSVP